METPSDRSYSPAHVWVRPEAGGRVRLGLTHVPARILGDAVYAELLPAGLVVAAGEPIGLVESSSTVFDVVAPVAGTIEAVNPATEDSPETITADPYGRGWLVELLPADPPGAELIDAAQYDLMASRD